MTREELERMVDSGDSYGVPGARAWAIQRLQELDDQVEVQTQALKSLGTIKSGGKTYKRIPWDATEHHEERTYAQKYADAQAITAKAVAELGCKGCGRVNRPYAKYCASCGSEVW